MTEHTPEELRLIHQEEKARLESYPYGRKTRLASIVTIIICGLVILGLGAAAAYHLYWTH